MRPIRTALFALIAVAALPALGSAQTLTVGQWSGTIAPPDEEPHPITYDVTVSGDTLKIVLQAAEHGSFPFRDIKLSADGTLTFGLEIGASLTCSLKRQENQSFEGLCTDAGGSSGKLVMVPPKKD